MNVAWSERTTEEQALLNPSFIALLLGRAISGHETEADGAGLPFPYAFIIVPIVLHPETRRSLPSVVTSSLAAWLPHHALEREMLGIRARELRRYVQEGIYWGLRSDLFMLEGAALNSGEAPRARRFRSNGDFDECLKKALFLGRWLARAGHVPTVLGMWGVRP